MRIQRGTHAIGHLGNGDMIEDPLPRLQAMQIDGGGAAEGRVSVANSGGSRFIRLCETHHTQGKQGRVGGVLVVLLGWSYTMLAVFFFLINRVVLFCFFNIRFFFF